MRPPKHDPAKPHCFLTNCSLNLEASRTNVSEETSYNWLREVSMQASGPPQGVARERGDKDYSAWPNPPITQTTLVQLCASSWVSRSRPAVTQPGIEHGSVVMPLALGCSALYHCTTREIFQHFTNSMNAVKHIYGIILCILQCFTVEITNKSCSVGIWCVGMGLECPSN